MANASVSRPPALPVADLDALHKLVIPSDEPSPTLDSGSDEEPLDIDQEDVQSLFQPALSPVATRLSSPRTPAAEKAAALENLAGGGLFSVIEGSATTGPLAASAPDGDFATLASSGKLSKPQTRPNRGLSVGQLPTRQQPPPPVRLPSPWQAGPKDFVTQNESGTRPLSGVWGQTRLRRSSSGGAEAMKRIREALPSMNSASQFLSNFKSNYAATGTFGYKNPPTDSKRSGLALDGNSESRQVWSPRASTPNLNGAIPISTAQTVRGTQSANRLSEVGITSRPSSLRSNRPRTIRRSTSDESMLYHSLSRVSSLGDDQRWDNIREMTNSRIKAIRDSWDRPTFKMPQLPDFFSSAPSKRNSLLGAESPNLTASAMPSPRSPYSGSFAKDGPRSEMDNALESLTGDVVVMGGYRGSILRSTKNKRQVWVPMKVGLKLRKVNLEVGLEPEDEEKMEETIYPSGMLQNIGPVDISKRLFKTLRECDNARTGKLRVWDYGWDWRLSPHLLSKKFITFLEQLPCNQGAQPKGATIIAHSLGGLITRHAVNQRPELSAGIIFAGTPQRCINILGPLRNGDAVLFNEKVLTAAVNFSLRTSFVMLPEDGFCFFNKYTGEEYPIDFFDADAWAKHHLSPVVGATLPAYNVRPSALGSLLNLSGSLPNLPLRSRGNSAASESRPLPSPTRNIVADTARRAEVAHDHTLAPQMGNHAGETKSYSQQQSQNTPASHRKYMKYLTRTLADTKKFRAELVHKPQLTESNSYPPMAIIYGKEVPTVYGAHVSSRDVIPCADAYDDLVFRSGDGVVLAREAMLPEGYELVNGGRVSSDRGHITLLGDMDAVGRALDAIIRGRRKGIGLGAAARDGKTSQGRAVQGERTPLA